MFQMDLTRRAAAHLARLEAQGFDVYATDDFTEIEGLVQQTGKPLRSPMFDLRRNDFTKGRAFWLFLRKGDDFVAGYAAQSIELGEEGFDSYIRRTTNAQYDTEADLIRVARPLVTRLQGHLIYMGDLHITQAARGRRQVLRDYARIGVLLSAMTWSDYDWMFAHIPYEHRSLQDVYGFASITHNAFTWGQTKPDLRDDSFAVIYQAKMDLMHSLLLDQPDHAAKNQRKG